MKKPEVYDVINRFLVLAALTIFLTGFFAGAAVSWLVASWNFQQELRWHYAEGWKNTTSYDLGRYRLETTLDDYGKKVITSRKPAP